MGQDVIRISQRLKDDLKKRRSHPEETYEVTIARLLKMTQEDGELSPATIQGIAKGIADIEAGRVYTSEQVKERLGFE